MSTATTQHGEMARSWSRSTASTPSGTCFCDSMGTGPAVNAGHDLALTELLDGTHRFLVEAGTEPRCEVLSELASRALRRRTSPLREVDGVRGRQMGRTMETDDIRDLLMRNLEHPRWDDVAERCLSCGNCTQVCPTCFCSSVEDTTDLSGDSAERTRVWDSCFSIDYSHIHGGSIRPSAPFALPAVDDPQAGDMVRPVRHFRLRRLRPLHHLVPGRNRHHRRGGGDQERQRASHAPA